MRRQILHIGVHHGMAQKKVRVKNLKALEFSKKGRNNNFEVEKLGKNIM